MTPATPARRRRAVVDPTMAATLRGLAPLTYGHGASPKDDVPAHVRAASAIRRRGDRLVIVQDDVNVLVLAGDDSAPRAVLLPAGAGGRRVFDEGRGNKHAKMDLEACVALGDNRLVAFGSGSTPARERLIVFGESGDVRAVDGSDLYAELRADTELAGSELNVEGALVVGDVVRLFQRGNGAPSADLAPVNATCDLPLADFLAWLDGRSTVAPCPRDVVQFDLGRVNGVAFGFTDAAVMADGSVAFLACAEASPDTYRDGEVLGCRFGVADKDRVRVADIRHEDGREVALKLEGLERRPGSAASFDVVVDMDRPDQPALIGRLDVAPTSSFPRS